jgi:hypothetical protein
MTVGLVLRKTWEDWNSSLVLRKNYFIVIGMCPAVYGEIKSKRVLKKIFLSAPFFTRRLPVIHITRINGYLKFTKNWGTSFVKSAHIGGYLFHSLIMMQ